MPLNASGPRVLLRRLREVMAEDIGAQQRLDKTAVLIASNMVAEVCSIYAATADGLELFATEGLNPKAVHETRLASGSGLVGLVADEAEPLNLTDAQSHPAFVYRPETGEEAYQSFLGVPILRAGHSLGVLVVQNRAQRQYTDEEVEALQTTAMVLAEILASGEFTEISRVVEDDFAHIRSHRIMGEVVAGAIGLGQVVLHEPRVKVTNLIAENVDQEKIRLVKAIGALRRSVDRMLQRAELSRFGEHRDVLEAYRMFAYDRGWSRKMLEAVETGLTAEAAVERVQNDNRARMLRSTDPYLTDRLHDFDDLANRLLRHLTDQEAVGSAGDLPKNAVVIARHMGPAELLDYDRERLRGVVLEEGGANSHVAIVARALDIACVGQARGVVDLVEPDDDVIVDGGTGEVHIRPPVDVVDAYKDKIRLGARRQRRYAKLRDRPAITKDGVRIQLGVNAGLLVELPHLREAGADGIGLFRTELQFMIASQFPRMAEQTAFYRSVLEAAGDRPVVFRSLDIGGDKVLPYLAHAKERNPALGWRALRMALDRPALLRLQMRALLRAAAGRTLNVMFPMVAELAEFKQAKQLAERERDFLAARGHELPAEIRLGVMLEVPSLLWQIDAISEAVDFISIGSNDLLQFLFASDRENPRLSHRYDALSPIMLTALRQVIDVAKRHATPVTLCGEMAGRPLEAMALIGIGLRAISMTPAAIGPVKSMITKLRLSDLEQALAGHLDPAGPSLRARLQAFAEQRKLLI